MKEDTNFDDYVYLNKIFLSIVGLWPLTNGKSTWRKNIQNFHMFTVYFLLFFGLLMPQLLDMYMMWGNMSAIVQNICNTFHAIMLLLKFPHLISKMNTFKVRLYS